MASKRSSVVKLGVFPSTGFVFRPVLDRLGQNTASFRAKLLVLSPKILENDRNPKEILVLGPKIVVFAAKMEKSGRWPRILPPKL